jgi:hypothetical protein
VSENRFEYEGPLSVSFEEGVYGEMTTGDWGEPNVYGVHSFEGEDLAEVIYDMLGGKRDKDGWSHARVVKRVRVVVEVLDADEHKPSPPPEAPTHDGVDFDPPPAPEVP